MPGKLLSLARKDAKNHITKGGFEENITLQTADSLTSVDVTGYATKHFLQFDSDGLPINTKNVHICISEDDLVDLSYPVRNAKNEVNLLHHKVTFKDSTGLDRTYKINENWPDESLGLIVCVLSDSIE
jgi:hypothetical protein